MYMFQDNLQILRDLSLLQVQMRDLEGYKVRVVFQSNLASHPAIPGWDHGAKSTFILGFIAHF